MTPLRTAVVGTGALGRHHARILAGLDGVELTHVAEINEDAGRAVADQHGAQWTADYRELFDRIDAVSIVVPTVAHRKVAGQFLSRGVPVLVEKPLAINATEAAELVELAERQHVILQVGHVERFNPATQAAWALCGEPKYIRAERVSPYAFRSTDIGAVLDLMIHDLDLVLDLARSPIVDCDAFGVCLLGGHEDTVQARLKFANGCIADLTANRVNPFFRRAMQIWTTTGAVTVDFTSREVTRFAPSEMLLHGNSPLELARQGHDVAELKEQMFGRFFDVDAPAVSDDDALTAELSDFVDCVRTDRQPQVSGREGLAAMQAAERVLNCVNRHAWDAKQAIGPHALLRDLRTPQRRAA